jgi:ribulose-5-phosphate 4-epimerase/fuculose-1-phosphate aldolase
VTATLSPSTTKYADLVVRAVRICVDADVMDFNGHCSVRDDSDPNIMYINDRHASRSTLTVKNIVPYDIKAGKRIGEGEEPPSEHWIHREIYLRHPEAKGIVHCHPENILTLSCAGHALRPLISIGVYIPEKGAPVFDSPVLINTEVRSKGMCDAMGDVPIVVLRQHGTVTNGGSLQEAVTRMVCAEKNAELQGKALAMGTPNFFHGKELEVLYAEQGGGPHGVKKYWTYLSGTAERNGAFAGL